VGEIIGYQVRIVLDPGYPDGTPQKLLDVSRLTALGWRHRHLYEGLKKTYDWFCRSPRAVGPREATPSV